MVAALNGARRRRAQRSFSAEVQDRIAELSKITDRDPAVRRANLATQIKVVALHAIFAGSLAGYLLTGGVTRTIVAIASVLLLGLAAIPMMRVFMHSQGHWGIGNGPVRNFLFDHLISVLFSVGQTGYALGHRAHHRFDNDFDPSGLPKDLQSTYLFSRDGKPSNIWVWMLFYLTVYQHAVHFMHVLNTRRWSVLLGHLLDYALIVGFHLVLYRVSPTFYLWIYLPSLGLAWLVSALSLYMMHDVPSDDYEIHPTLNCADPVFNWFGDNDGYHLEHSLYPHLHPKYLKEVSDLIQPPASQVIHAQYALAALPALFRGRSSRA